MFSRVKHISRRSAALYMMLLMLVVLGAGIGYAQTPDGPTRLPDLPDEATATPIEGVPESLAYLVGDAPAPTDRDYLMRIAENEGTVRVIVRLNTRFASALPFEMLSATSQRQVIETAAGRVLSLPEVANAQSVKTYDAFPLVAMAVDAAGLEALLKSPNVAGVSQDRFRVPHLADSTILIGADGEGGAWARGYTGVGQTVAILDSGFDKSHPFLTDKVVSEACYSTNGTAGDEANPIILTSTCPGGVTESTSVDSAPPCNVPGNECIHGTHIAGIAVGKGTNFSGVAPDATLIGIQVYTHVKGAVCKPYTGTLDCIFALDSDSIKGLNRVFALKDEYNIAAVNLSFGSGAYTTVAECEADSFNKPYITPVKQLKDAGIAVVASAGNSGYINALGAPACLSDIISVGASGSESGNNTIYPTSNTASYLDFVAPGYRIRSSVPLSSPDAPYLRVSGTSVAAPHITAAYALMRDYREEASLTDIYEALKTTGTPIDRFGFGVFIRPNIGDAIQWLIIPETPELLTPADDVEFNEPGITFTWTSGLDTDRYRLRVFNAAGERVLNERILHADCTDTCTYTLTTPLQDRQAHTWHVVAQNAQREAQSETRSFYVDYPGKPQLVSPLNNVNFNRPDEFDAIVWNVVPAADEYRLIVRNRTVGGKLLDVTLLANECTETTCTYTVTPEVQNKLVDGHLYQWFVRATNEFGLSNSAKRSFTTQFPAPPDLVSPVDNFVAVGPSQINSFTWDEVLDVPEYRIQIKNVNNGALLVNKVLQAGDVCAAMSCAYTLTTQEKEALKGSATYKWWVQSRNDLGKSKSEAWRFSTDFPGKPVLISPATNTVFNDPSEMNLLQWQEVIDVTTYRIFIRNKNNGDVVRKVTVNVGAGITCESGVCSYIPTATDQEVLKDKKTYQWYVQARSIYGNNKSAKNTFTTAFPGKSELIAPVNNTLITELIQFDQLVWESNPYVDKWTVVIRDVTKGKVVTKIPIVNTHPMLSCGADQCVFTVNEATQMMLKDKRTYKWFVRASNEYGTYKSGVLRFSVQLEPLPAVQLVAPLDGITIKDPSELTTLVWQEVPKATRYTVVIDDATKNFRFLKDDVMPGGPTLTCDGVNCTYTIPAPLLTLLKDRRTYEWRILASNISTSSRSPKASFKTRMPGAVQILTPADDTRLNSRGELATMTWSANPYTDSYRLIVKDVTAGKTAFKVNLPVDNSNPVCDALTCTYTVPQDLRDALRNNRTYRWFVRTGNEYGSYKSNRLVFKTRF